MGFFKLTCRKRFKEAAGRPWRHFVTLLILRNYSPRPTVKRGRYGFPLPLISGFSPPEPLPFGENGGQSVKTLARAQAKPSHGVFTRRWGQCAPSLKSIVPLINDKATRGMAAFSSAQC